LSSAPRQNQPQILRSGERRLGEVRDAPTGDSAAVGACSLIGGDGGPTESAAESELASVDATGWEGSRQKEEGQASEPSIVTFLGLAQRSFFRKGAFLALSWPRIARTNGPLAATTPPSPFNASRAKVRSSSRAGSSKIMYLAS
jgi:hypothetical protein